MHRHSAPGHNTADNLSTVEELRRLQTSLDLKRQNFTQIHDDKQCEIDRREKSLIEREV